MSMSTLLPSSPNLAQTHPSFFLRSPSKTCFRTHDLDRVNQLQFGFSSSRIQPLKFNRSGFSVFSKNGLGFSCGRNLSFSAGAQNGGGEGKSVVDEAEEARGQSTMPERFRHLTEEVPDRPVRWPWFIALAFLIYAWRTVLWELSNWKKAALSITNFLGYLLKLTLAIIYHFIGDPITTVIRCVETVLYTMKSIYSDIVAFAPVRELMVIIMLTSVVLSIAEATAPESINNQPYLLTFAGVIGFTVVRGFIPELLFCLLLVGLFCFSRFVKKRDNFSSALPIAAVLVAVGEPWFRAVVMALYLILAISHHSKRLSEGKEGIEVEESRRVLPFPLLIAGLAIGINIAAKWVRYRHLTWMIV